METDGEHGVAICLPMTLKGIKRKWLRLSSVKRDSDHSCLPGNKKKGHVLLKDCHNNAKTLPFKVLPVLRDITVWGYLLFDFGCFCILEASCSQEHDTIKKNYSIFNG